MQKCPALIAACKPPLTAALLGAFLFTGDPAIAEPYEPAAPDTATAAGSNCDPQNVIVYQADQAPESAVACSSETEITTVDRDYLTATATPGSTMVRQGPELAIGRLHPEFVRRLAAAIREARQAGLAAAGIFSAYRPPAFGVGGFSDKFNSLHTYGLAVDMSGIGGPGSAEAKLWHEIAARHGVACPYGAQNRREWNHCQPTRVRIVLPENRLRETVTASGPIDLVSMFEAGDSLIESLESVVEGVNADAAAPAALVQADLAERRLGEQAWRRRTAMTRARGRRTSAAIAPEPSARRCAQRRRRDARSRPMPARTSAAGAAWRPLRAPKRCIAGRPRQEPRGIIPEMLRPGSFDPHGERARILMVKVRGPRPRVSHHDGLPAAAA